MLRLRPAGALPRRIRARDCGARRSWIRSRQQTTCEIMALIRMRCGSNWLAHSALKDMQPKQVGHKAMLGCIAWNLCTAALVSSIDL